MSESTNKTREDIFRSLQVRRGFRTLSRARRKELLLQLKSKSEADAQAQNNSTSLKGSKNLGASASLHTHLMMSLVKWGSLPKAIFLWARFRFMKMLINMRNKPPKILLHPDEKLKRVALPVDFKKTTLEERTEIVRKMGAALNQQNWGQKLGIAAPQIGINLRVMVVRGNVMFNPEWNPSRAPAEFITEGCYSVPRKVFKVSRAPYGWAKWVNIEGRPMESKLNGLPAIVFQHELNHLDGTCIADIGEEIKIEGTENGRTPSDNDKK